MGHFVCQGFEQSAHVRVVRRHALQYSIVQYSTVRCDKGKEENEEMRKLVYERRRKRKKYVAYDRGRNQI